LIFKDSFQKRISCFICTWDFNSQFYGIWTIHFSDAHPVKGGMTGTPELLIMGITALAVIILIVKSNL